MRLVFLLVLCGCGGPVPLTRSVILRNASVPSSGSGFEPAAEVCATQCGAPRPGERLLWCHEANMEKDTLVPGTQSTKENAMVLVCNYGGN